MGALGQRFDPALAQWVKDPALWQLWLRLQLRLRSDPRPQNSMYHHVVEERKKERKEGRKEGRKEKRKLLSA